MRKLHIKLSFSRIIPSFQSCRSKDPSTLPSHPTPTPKAPNSSMNSHVSSTQQDHLFQWQKDENFHVIAKINPTHRQKIYTHEETLPNKRLKKRTPRRRKRRVVESENERVAARLSGFQRMIPCAVEGKVKESLAVVKRSKDPYGDFKRSMVEMVVEKRMVEEEELEQLLVCLLSLNSRDHHGVIVRAFSEVWESLFVCDRY